MELEDPATAWILRYESHGNKNKRRHSDSGADDDVGDASISYITVPMLRKYLRIISARIALINECGSMPDSLQLSVSTEDASKAFRDLVFAVS